MTGAETKELLIQSLRAEYWLLQRPEDVEQVFAEALAALTPCVVLTAEEAEANAEALREGLTYADACDTWPRGPHEKADHEGHKQDMRNTLALLTPSEEA